MSRYINKYTNQSAIEDALDNGLLKKPYVAYIEDEESIDWDSKETSYSKKYLTFKITSAGTINVPTGTTYSINGGEWENTGTTLTVSGGESIRFKGNNSKYFGNTFMNSTAGFEVEGNLMSLVYGDNFVGETTLVNYNNFRTFFQNCTGLTSAKNLIIPATTLTNSCYDTMFKNCTSLVTAPELPATTLANYCYYEMFRGCTSLNYIKCLATNISATNCLDNWVRDVASSGTFVKTTSMTGWETGYSGIPSGWTVVEV